MKPHIEEARRALRLADRDVRAFKVLAASPDVHLTIIFFHAQQAVEKAFKAALFSHRIEFRRTHNLADLASLLRQDGIDVPLADAQLLRLNQFAVTFRYDDVDVPVPNPNEVAEWMAMVMKWAEALVRAVENTPDTNTV